MLNGDSNRCCCLFGCECDKVERLILDWTSQDALDIVKSRLFSFTDPTEIFARLACVLFYREIINARPVNCTKENLKKADIAFRFASAFANELDDCIAFYSSCWKKFQDLVSRLEVKLKHFSSASRRVIPLQLLIEEMLPELEVSHSVPLSADDAGTESVVADPTVRSTNEAVDSQISSTGAPVKMEIADNQFEAQLGSNQTPVIAVQNSTVVRKSSDDRADDNGQPQHKRAKLSTSVERPDDLSGDGHGEMDEDSDEERLQKSNGTLSKEEGDSGSVSQRWMYQCNIANCGRRFKYDFLLPKHRELHHGGVVCNFVCDDCGQDFEANQNLCGHKKVHDQTREFKCSYCDYRYSARKYLKRHGKSYHSGRF